MRGNADKWQSDHVTLKSHTSVAHHWRPDFGHMNCIHYKMVRLATSRTPADASLTVSERGHYHGP